MSRYAKYTRIWISHIRWQSLSRNLSMRRTQELWVLDISMIDSSASGRLLEICPSGNHRDDYISLYPWFIKCSLNNIISIDRQVCDLPVKLITWMIILNWSLVGFHVRTHMNIRLAHVLVDDYVSQVMDMGMSNQLCEHMLRNMELDRPNLRHCGHATLVSCNMYAMSSYLRL